jgi:hypothetical protein
MLAAPAPAGRDARGVGAWLEEAAPGLLANRSVRAFLESYPQRAWPEVLRLALLHGIASLDASYPGLALTPAQLRAVVERGAAAAAVERKLPALQRELLDLQYRLDGVYDDIAGGGARRSGGGGAPRGPAVRAGAAGGGGGVARRALRPVCPGPESKQRPRALTPPPLRAPPRRRRRRATSPAPTTKARAAPAAWARLRSWRCRPAVPATCCAWRRPRATPRRPRQRRGRARRRAARRRRAAPSRRASTRAACAAAAARSSRPSPRHTGARASGRASPRPGGGR